MSSFRKTVALFIIGTALFTSMPTQHAQSAIPVLEIIKQGIIWVIKAVDLMIQRLQTETIWLQNAQKVLENKLSQFKLAEIAQWTDKQRQLYSKYYDELWKVRQTIATYHRVTQIINRQKQIIEQYKFTWTLISQDKHFTRSEIEYMYKVYTGIINDSVYNLDQVLLVINAYKTQMSDAKRLEIIDKAADNIDQNYNDLIQFNQQNKQLSINRAKDTYEIESLKKLYGLTNE